MKVVTVVGARPQFIKAAVVSRKLRAMAQEVIVHTGQHYDYNMSDIFFEELEIPKPDYNLGISGGSHGKMTGAMLAALEEGNDIVIGSRFLAVKKPKTLRMLGSYIISWSIRLTTGRAICDPTSGMRMFNRAMVEEFAQNLNYGPEPDTISYLIKNGATVKEVQVEMGERLAGQSYLTFWRSVQYMVKMSISILLIQWFRKRDTETPYPERSL